MQREIEQLDGQIICPTGTSCGGIRNPIAMIEQGRSGVDLEEREEEMIAVVVRRLIAGGAQRAGQEGG